MTDIMIQLKESTAVLHDQAERHPFQQAMVKGRLSRDGFVRFLAQMHHVHSALEMQLLRVQRFAPGDGVIKPYHYRTPLLADDLRFFGCSPRRIALVPAIVRLTEAMDEAVESCDAAALGFLYVLEGSTNGSRFIAKSVQRAYNLKPFDGHSSLDPHQAEQSVRWGGFKQNMSAFAWSDTQRHSVLAAAEQMFRGIMRISDDLVEADTIGAVETPNRKTVDSTCLVGQRRG